VIQTARDLRRTQANKRPSAGLTKRGPGSCKQRVRKRRGGLPKLGLDGGGRRAPRNDDPVHREWDIPKQEAWEVNIAHLSDGKTVRPVDALEAEVVGTHNETQTSTGATGLQMPAGKFRSLMMAGPELSKHGFRSLACGNRGRRTRRPHYRRIRSSRVVSKDGCVLRIGQSRTRAGTATRFYWKK
jgi:hypothetical protein